MTDTLVNLTIEGRPVAVPAGTSILEAAKLAGVLVPHYCYHPGLPVAGVCRMCLVEIEKMPKLAPSCATTVSEGQVVYVHSEKALEARKSVLEFLLINHPLDCPICDQSGECELQDYTFAEGRQDSRYREPKRFNPVEDFGGDVMYVGNRCILCTRCVRFMDDVHEKPVLNVSERGDRAHIGIAFDADMNQPWGGNVVDLCPVGALLSKDFLNKARAWELDRTASVCPGCSQGCNTTIETRDNTVMRWKPRSNDDVNKYFMCDEGRLDYRWTNRPDRLIEPLVDGKLVDWSTAVAAAAKHMESGPVRIVASPRLSNEAMGLLKAVAGRRTAEVHYTVPQGAEAPLPGVKDLSLRADRAPNAMGAELLGFKRADNPLAGLAMGDVLVLVDVELAEYSVADINKASAIIVIGTTLPVPVTTPAVVLPIANFTEEDGTWTNLRGRVQRFMQAKAAPGMARPSWYALSDLATALGAQGTAVFTASAAFDFLAKEESAFAGLNYDALGLKGAVAAGALAGAK
jgi:NADH-quinone oxidoreductase subunit G